MASPTATSRETGELLDRPAAAATAWSLLLDQRTVAVIGLLGAAHVRAVLLKGPVTARRLYPDVVRPRGDTDLLVDPARFDDAARVLLGHGFRRLDPAGHAQTFLRGPGEVVDVHWRLPLTTVPPARLWARLQCHVVPFDLHGYPVEALDVVAHAAHLAIHVVQEADRRPAPRADLERAVRAYPPSVWIGALALARDLGADVVLTAALRTGSATARALADSAGVPAGVPFRVRLRFADRSRFVRAAGALGSVPPAHRRALLRRWLLPSRVEVAARAGRPDVLATTPAGLPPSLRLLAFRGRQVVRFSLAVARIARSGDRPGRRGDEVAADGSDGRFRLGAWNRKLGCGGSPSRRRSSSRSWIRSPWKRPR